MKLLGIARPAEKSTDRKVNFRKMVYNHFVIIVYLSVRGQFGKMTTVL